MIENKSLMFLLNFSIYNFFKQFADFSEIICVLEFDLLIKKNGIFVYNPQRTYL